MKFIIIVYMIYFGENRKYCTFCKTTFNIEHFVDCTLENGRVILTCKLRLEEYKGKRVGKRKKSNKISVKRPRKSPKHGHFENIKPATPEYRKNVSLLRSFGISYDDFLIMKDNCNNLCNICNTHEKIMSKKGKLHNLSVDHCHETGKIRGLLCRSCNKGIGLFDDNVILIKNAILYLKTNNRFLFNNLTTKKYINDRKNYDKNIKLLKNYGISLENYKLILDTQNCLCAICGIHESKFKRPLSVDHNHFTGDIRGLLCAKCNLGIGSLLESEQIMSSAIEYLNKHNYAS